jgi:hypothetical protein
MTPAVKVPGTNLPLGGQDYVLAPLNAAAVKQYRDKIANVFVGGLPDIGLVAELAFNSLRRNYPDITIAVVEEMIDYGNMFDVWEVLMNISGLVEQAGKMARRVQEQMATMGLTAS